MKSFQFAALALVTLLALGVGSVYANTGEGDLGLPILGTTGSPALAAPSLFSGVITVLYADGTPVVLEFNTVNLDLCGGSGTCSVVVATLKQTAPGTYAYSFTPPSLNGTVTIYVKAYALADDNGRIFPQVDTSIGAYSYTPSSPSSSSSSAATPPPALPPANTPTMPPLTSQAVNTQPTQSTTPVTGPSPLQPLLIVLSALAVAGSILVASKKA